MKVVSLNQYIVYVLTRQVTLAYSVSAIPKEEIQQQKQSFNALVQDLGQVSLSEIATVLTERETVSPEKELDSKTVALLQQRIQDKAKTQSDASGGV